MLYKSALNFSQRNQEKKVLSRIVINSLKPSNSNFIKVKWELDAQWAMPVLWPFFEPVLPAFFVEFPQENTFYSSLLHLKIKKKKAKGLILSVIWIYNFCLFIALVWLLTHNHNIYNCMYTQNGMFYIRRMPSPCPYPHSGMIKLWVD